MVPFTLRVHRHRLRGTTTTRSQLPPGVVPRGRYSALFVLLALWAWLTARGGLLRRDGEHPAVTLRPEARTLQRWLARARDRALRLQHALRTAILEKCEPRPVERLWEEIRGPPSGLRRFRVDSAPVTILWRALAMTWSSATSLRLSVPFLLAEARWRWTGPEDIWPLA